MVRRAALMMAAAAIAAVTMTFGAAPAAAHAGHAHKVMGTVTMVAPDHVMVKAKEKGETEEKIVHILVNDKTKVLKGATAATMKDVATGQRVVIDVGDGKTPLTAKSITVGTAKAAGGTN